MSKQQSIYRNIIKSTSIFGGVQIYQILINLIESKFVAAFIGAAGVGISGILVSTIAIINSIAGLGLSFSATREIAQASHEEDSEKLERIYTIFSRWLYVTSIIGVIIVILFSKSLSEYAFGNKNYTWAFVWMSTTVLFTILTSKNNTLLQGTRKLKYMAKSSVIGSTVGLFISIPLYFFFGVKGIVPSLIIIALSSFLVSRFFVLKLGLKKVNLSTNQLISGGSAMVKLGMIMMIGTLLGTLVTFTINAFISRYGSLADVGLYNAGNAITSQFVGLVFTALTVDYFPRLSSISSDNAKVSEMVNQQSEIVLLIILPLLITMILTTPLLIKILLTQEFIKVIPFVRIVAFGTIFQAAGYTIGYIPLAKGDMKNFFLWNALFGNMLGAVILTAGYKIYGLNGLAISLLLHHLITFLVLIVVTKKLYNYTISRLFFYFLSVCIVMIGLVLYVITYFPNVYGYLSGAFMLFISVTFSIYNLNKLLDIKESYHAFISKRKKA